MARGKIKRIFAERGYGFIRLEDNSEVFFHRSSVKDTAFESLAEGQEVEVQVQSAARGPRASEVKPVQEQSRT
ncbi:MAG: cold shock domain-containing protein [Armatimonadetes bacterium]|nr:cold shock domain-containing protein [Armatimonadota bacterium]